MTEPLTAAINALPTAIRFKLQTVRMKLEVAHAAGKTEFTDPLEFIAHHRRVDSTQEVPLPFRKIAIELSQLTGVDVTHEAVRRWQRAVERLDAQMRQQAAAP